jgi:hypothetical protein
MAVGDDAQAGGFPIVPETGEAGRIRWGALEINRTRDFVALVKATVPTTKASFRLASGITFGVGDPSGGADGDVHFKVADGVTLTFVRSGGVWVQSPVGGSSGTEITLHSQLTGRDAINQHPISSITGLQSSLDGKASNAHGTHVPSPAGEADNRYLRTLGGGLVYGPAPSGGGSGDGMAVPAGGQYVFATDDEEVANAYPEFVWIMLDAIPAPATVPDAPSIGTATAGDGQATVPFTAPTNDGGAIITGYTATSSPGGLTATGVSSPLTVLGLTNGTVYTFTVVATNSVGSSTPSASSNSVTPQAVAVVPDAPASLTATRGDTQISLAWTASASATGYRVYRHTADIFASATQVGSDLGSAVDSYLDTTVMNGTIYYYWIVAFNAVGTSGPSPVAFATPAADGEFLPSDVAGGILAMWYDAADTATITLEDTDRVAGVSDKSGNNRHLVAAATRRPVLVTAAQNELDVIRNNSDNQLEHDALADVIDVSPMTGFAVVLDNSSSIGYRRIMSLRQSAVGLNDYEAPNFTINKNNALSPREMSAVSNGLQTLPQVGYTHQAYTIWTWKSLSTGGSLRNGQGAESTVSGNAQPANMRYIRVGAEITSAEFTSASSSALVSGRWVGDICEIIIYNGELTVQECADVQTYLANKWGITL